MDGLMKAQVILYVGDMETSVAFYRDVLGLRVVWPVDGSVDAHWTVVGAAGTEIALHGGREGEVGEDAPGLSFVVRDLGSVLALVRERGGCFGDAVNPHPGVVFSVGHDPDGHVVTLKQG